MNRPNYGYCSRGNVAQMVDQGHDTGFWLGTLKKTPRHIWKDNIKIVY
jgi:hypothetical protein